VTRDAALFRLNSGTVLHTAKGRAVNEVFQRLIRTELRHVTYFASELMREQKAQQSSQSPSLLL
jgi:hypothetical protein